MSQSQTLYRKYRPQKFSEIKSQDHITEILKKQVENSTFSHAYIFTGPRGTGKTSTARIFARAINCLNSKKGEPCNKCENCKSAISGGAMDIIEIDAASNRSIDDVRDFKEKVNFSPVAFRKKVFIIDEVHMLTKEAFNALLKTLEEPPDFVVFILATTDVHKVPPTILSRCQRFEFKLAEDDRLIDKLKNICESEGVVVNLEVLKLVMKQGNGSFRDSESILEKIIHSSDGKTEIGFEEATNILGLSKLEGVAEIVKLLVLKDFVNVKTYFENQIVKSGVNLDIFVSQLEEYLEIHLMENPYESVQILKKLFELNKELRFEKNKKLMVEVYFWEICEPHIPRPESSLVGHPFLKKGESNPSEKSSEILLSPLQVSRGASPERSTPKGGGMSGEEENGQSEDMGIQETVEGLNLDTIISKWLDLVTIITQSNPHMSAYISNARPHSLTGQILNIVVKYKLHKDLLEKTSSIEVLRNTFVEVYGEIARNIIFKFYLQKDIDMIGGARVGVVDQTEILGDLV